MSDYFKLISSHFSCINTIKKYNHTEVASTLLRLIDTGLIDWGRHAQICINAPADKTDNVHFGAGSLVLDWANATQVTTNGIVSVQVPQRTELVVESDFTDICDVFKGTIFEDMVLEISKVFTVGRIRIMKLDPNNCLSWHQDSSLRLHFPIITHQDCKMVIEDEVKHINIGEWTLTNTLLPHTAFNPTKVSRIHLVVCIL